MSIIEDMRFDEKMSAKFTEAAEELRNPSPYGLLVDKDPLIAAEVSLEFFEYILKEFINPDQKYRGPKYRWKEIFRALGLLVGSNLSYYFTCPYCGRESYQDNDINFCPYCGWQLEHRSRT